MSSLFSYDHFLRTKTLVLLVTADDVGIPCIQCSPVYGLMRECWFQLRLSPADRFEIALQGPPCHGHGLIARTCVQHAL